MSDRYHEYEMACTQIRQQNAVLLSDFSDWLTRKGGSQSTVQSHVGNIDFYVNDYLLYEDAIAAKDGCYKDGCYHVGTFLGYWFIRKAVWASASSIRSNASSLKKFYAFIQEKGLVEEEAVKELRETIKDGMPDWLATLRRYDDPEITDPMEVWGL